MFRKNFVILQPYTNIKLRNETFKSYVWYEKIVNYWCVGSCRYSLYCY
jgi:hypothetical protein